MKQSGSILITAGFAFLVAAPASYGQTVRGHLLDQTTGQPIPAGFVVLLGDNLTEYDRSLTDRQGRFELAAPGPGRYALRSVVIGIQSTMTPPFELLVGQEIAVEFAIEALVVTLPTVVIEDERTCAGPTEVGMAAATLWEEARKALNVVVWTQNKQMLRHHVMLYERELDPNTLKVMHDRTWSHSDYNPGSLFQTADSVSTAGYIQQTDKDELIFAGPDANVLLSEEFASRHCFGLVQGDGDRAGLIGLSFEPVLKQSLPDIEGVLWLDTKSAELRFLEFSYTHVSDVLQSEHIGGRVEFERLPLGPWVVRRWWIRMPILGVRQKGFSDFIRETYIEYLEEDGGWVTEIEMLDGTPLVRVGVTTLTGKVMNLRAAKPLAGARMILVGTEYEARTDRNGDFRFEGLPEGTYRVSYGSEVLKALGYVPPLVEVSLSIDQPEALTLVIPPLSQLWSDICPGSDSQQSAIIMGFIRDSLTLQPISGAQVIAYRAGTEGGTGGELTNWAGHYRLCGLPGEVTWTVEVARADTTGVTIRRANMTVSTGDIVQIDFAIPESGGGTTP